MALILLTASVGLGIANTSKWSAPVWPRFVTAGLHRYVSLLVLAVLAVHILTAELDTFAPVGRLAVIVPFASSYRPVWLGLGTLAFDLLLALVVTSLLRTRIGYRTWKAVHWIAYLSWPIAVLHGLGTGTDPRLGWVQLITVACALFVVIAAGWRLAQAWTVQPQQSLMLGVAAAALVIALIAWSVSGPLAPGWARRAGTPLKLLGSSQPVTSSSGANSPGPSTTAPATSGSGGTLAAPPFTASLLGTLSQTGPNPSGEVTVTISTVASGTLVGTLTIILHGPAASGGGLTLATGSVSLGPTASPGEYQGRVVSLNGDQIVASVEAKSASALQLTIDLQIDQATGSVTGDVQAQLASSSGRRKADRS